MGAVVGAAWRALCFDATALRRWSLAHGLALVLVASLTGGLAAGAARAHACVQRPPPGPAERQAAEGLAGWLSRTPLAFDAQRALVRNVAAALALRGDVAALPRPLGRQAGCALEGLQWALAAPYRRLALWLPYTLAVYALARALGSRAGLAEMLAATSLYALPHLLDLLQPLPGWGPLAGALGFFWGVAIYAWAIGAVCGLGRARTAIALALPALAAITLVAVLLAGVVAILCRS